MAAKEALTGIFNGIFRERKVPKTLKTAYKLMIPKPGKDSRDMDNYRGITIAPILLKILEILCMDLGLEETIQEEISCQQVGFTKNRSPSMASLVITETVAEAKYMKIPLYVASLDARKAFDVVNHYRLKTKLYNTQTLASLWTLIDDLYQK